MRTFIAGMVLLALSIYCPEWSVKPVGVAQWIFVFMAGMGGGMCVFQDFKELTK